MVALFRELGWLRKSCALLAVSMVFLLGEIGHFLIGATSKVVAEDLHYGDITCQLNSSTLSLIDLPIKCGKAKNVSYCESLTLNGSRYCEWNYNGLGWDYQVLAGPSFIAMFTVGGVVMGIIADKYNRVTFLAISTLVMGIAIALMGAVTEYRQLFILRMMLAFGEAGVSPLGTSLLSDWFPREQHGLVMSLFNWGVYGGWGITFPIGRYVPSLNVWGLSWRICYYIPGIVTIIFGIMVFFILEEPKKRNVGDDATDSADDKQQQQQQQQQQKEGVNEREIIEQNEKPEEEDVSLCQVLLAPSFVLFCIAGCLRQCAGFCFAYNSDLYYRDYFPDVDLGWPLFWVTIFIGSVGVVVGGIVSDKLVTRMGVKSRVAVLSFSQLMATPFALGSVGFGPLGAMMSLSVSFFFAEMWLGILFAILVAIIPTRVRTTAMSIFLFIINNVGGNLPILVEPTRQKIGYKEALYIYYAGFYFLSSIGFFITIFFMEGKAKVPKDIKQEEGYTNGSIIYDEKKVPNIELPIRPSVQEDKKL